MDVPEAIHINEKILDLAVEKKVRPLVDAGAFDDPGNEGYHHMKVLPAARLCLTPEAIQSSPVENFKKAVVSASSNLLFTQEKIWAKQMAIHCDADELKRHLLDLLYGTGELLDRIKTFQTWAALRPVPGTDFKQGCSHTVISYMLAMIDPKRYAFCKPRVYKAAAAALLGKKGVVKDKAARLLHASAFYAELLRLFTTKYGLPFEDLLHVHSALFRLTPENNPDSANWENLEAGVSPPPVIKSDPPPEIKGLEGIAGDEIGALLLERKNVILYGPPGTGKTFRALELAKKWRQSQGEAAVEQVTFHPSYAYEDFIEGFRPADDGSFALRNGLFVDFARRAGSDLKRQHLLIIDEINRGDVARLFGELITLIEADKRRQDVARKLPYSKQDFWVPPNLYILGTMNTADRSISLMDIAIRRRFSFFGCSPDTQAFAGNYLREIGGVSLADLLDGINTRLQTAGVDRDRAVGHSYFMIPVGDGSPLSLLWTRLRYDVFPLIEEYCYADRSMIRLILGDLVDERGELDDQLDDDEQALTAALKDLAAMD